MNSWLDSEAKFQEFLLLVLFSPCYFSFLLPPQDSGLDRRESSGGEAPRPYSHLIPKLLRRNPGSFPPLRDGMRGIFLLAFLPQPRFIKSAFFLPQRATKKCQEIQPRGGSGVRTRPGLTCELVTLCGGEELTSPSSPGPFPTPELMFMTQKPLDQLNSPSQAAPGCEGTRAKVNFSPWVWDKPEQGLASPPFLQGFQPAQGQENLGLVTLEQLCHLSLDWELSQPLPRGMECLGPLRGDTQNLRLLSSNPSLVWGGRILKSIPFLGQGDLPPSHPAPGWPGTIPGMEQP